MEFIKNYLISTIRTGVPALVGFLAAWAATKGVTFDDQTKVFATLAFEGLASMLYYVIVRGLESVNHRFGWLLGYAKMPDYTPGVQSPSEATPVGK